MSHVRWQRGHGLRWLLSHIRAAPLDEFTLIQVTGSEGIGKTRLVEAALAQLRLQGIQVASSECTEFSHQIPFSGLSRILSSERVLAIVRGVPESSRVLLAPFVSAIGFPASSARPVNEPSDIPGGVWEAFRMAFEELARTQPLVLFVDRLEWIDRSSLSLLSYIRDRWTRGSLTLVTATALGW